METANTHVIANMTQISASETPNNTPATSARPVNNLLKIKWKLVKMMDKYENFHYNFCTNSNGLTLNIVVSPELCIPGDEKSVVKSEGSEKGGNSRKRRRARRQLELASTDSLSGYDSGKNEHVPIKGFKKEDIKPFVWMKQGKEELPAKTSSYVTRISGNT